MKSGCFKSRVNYANSHSNSHCLYADDRDNSNGSDERTERSQNDIEYDYVYHTETNILCWMIYH